MSEHIRPQTIGTLPYAGAGNGDDALHPVSLDPHGVGARGDGEKDLAHPYPDNDNADGASSTEKQDAEVPGQQQPVAQDDGVTRIEALYVVFGKGWGLYGLWLSIALIAYVYALSRSTTFAYASFATSFFGSHTSIGTIGVVNAIIRGVSPPFLAKLADVWGRPQTYCFVIACFSIGYAMCAGAKNVDTVVAGQIIYTVGNAGVTFLNSLILADITSLQWRGFVNGAVNLPYVINAFVGAEITSGINGYNGDGWRWGFGMFAIMLPVSALPCLVVLFIGDRRARQLGVLSLASATNSARQEIAGADAYQRTLGQSVLYYLSRFNVLGFLLMGFSFALLLTPSTLSVTAENGYKNPSLIAMLTIGGVLFIAWAVWDGLYAAYPIMPRRVLNRTFFACLAIDFFYFFSSYLVDAYFLSWVWVVVDWTDKQYSYFGNTVTVTMCTLGIVTGTIMRVTHRYKYLQIGGLAIRCIGVGLTYYATKRPTDGVLVSSQVLIGIGGAISITSSYVAVQASVPHQDMGIAVAVLNLWSSIGSSISIAISAAVWNTNLPAKLNEYLAPTHNATEIAQIFGSIQVARLAEPRELVKQAYLESVQGLFLSALIVMFVALFAGFFASNYYLGAAHNAIETDKIIKFRDQKEVDEEIAAIKAKAREQRA